MFAIQNLRLSGYELFNKVKFEFFNNQVHAGSFFEKLINIAAL